MSWRPRSTILVDSYKITSGDKMLLTLRLPKYPDTDSTRYSQALPTFVFIQSIAHLRSAFGDSIAAAVLLVTSSQHSSMPVR